MSRDGGRVVFDTTVVQSADPQVMSGPDIPPGAEVRLESMKSTGSGRTILDLAKVAPVESTMSLDVDMKMVSKMEAMSFPIEMGFTFQIGITER